MGPGNKIKCSKAESEFLESGISASVPPPPRPCSEGFWPDRSLRRVGLNEDECGRKRNAAHSFIDSSRDHYPMRNEHQRRTTETKVLSEPFRLIHIIWETRSSTFPSGFPFSFACLCFHLIGFLSSFSKPTSKEIKAEREVAVCRRYWKPYRALPVALLPGNFQTENGRIFRA